MDDAFFRKVTTTIVLAVLIVLSFFLLRPILLSIIMGFILTFIFSPIYNQILRLTKSKTFSSILICVLLIALIIVPLWFLTPLIIDESIKLFVASQQLDVVTPLKTIFPSLFASEVFSEQVGIAIQSFVTKMTSSLMTYLSDLLLDFPTIILHILIVFFTLFYTLKDKEEIISYIKSILPFPKDIEKKLFDSTKNITFSVLYGYIIIGTLQGIILGIGLFIFQVPSAFILFLLAIVAGILPILGPSLIGIPTAIFLMMDGNIVAAFGILIFTIAASLSDYFIRPTLVSKKAKLPTALILVGMIGGFLMFGILGFILGPLIIAYMIIILELYKTKKAPSALAPEKTE
ncbi:MAG: AI-2E family transporter [Candidatus Nanoarchaeia archaeon]|nr:AI-2E family transporter [Candidatus Nanoarchaeia archaeon]MDD5357531.1 AI-2E family transporter [Candidatus Nanoarchaeia archaeon]MDD5588450.1 AI-2E family transporter [Candidatus Nanoarchaeia archaeon]